MLTAHPGSGGVVADGLHGAGQHTSQHPQHSGHAHRWGTPLTWIVDNKVKDMRPSQDSSLASLSVRGQDLFRT